MTIEIRDPSLEARIRRQLQETGSSSVEEVLLRLLEATLGSVILSEATASRMRSSRAVEGSLPACSAPTPQGVSASAPDCFGSTPRDGIGSSSCKGSFDCVVARFATDNFAQDDRAVRADEYHAKQNAPDSFESWDVCRSALPQVLLNHKTKRKPHIGKWLVRAITSTKVTTHGSSGTSGHSVDLPRIRPVLVDMFTT
jgi:hypothetical protein